MQVVRTILSVVEFGSSIIPMRRHRSVALLLALITGVFLLGPPTTFADDTKAIEELKRENVELKKRLEKLEAALNKMQGTISKPPAKEPSEQIIDKAVDKTIERLKAKAKDEKPAVRSKYPIDFYGFIKLDASYDTARMDNGNFARWVESEARTRHDDMFNMTARQSRFGVNIGGPQFGKVKTSGKLEIDFYGGGGGGPENRNWPQMRHAYLLLDWAEYDFSVLAGQTTDVVSPLLPPTLNYAVLWNAGNPGYRRPQIRLTKGFDIGDSRLLFQAAAARPIGGNPFFSFDGRTGEDSGVPHVQARAALTFPLLTKKPTTIGFSGVWGKEEWDEPRSPRWQWDDFSIRNNGRNYDTWMLCADVTVPLFEKVRFKGEVWTGQNLQTYFAGIGQGVDQNLDRFWNGATPTSVFEIWGKPIASTGGWGAVTFGPFDKWTFNLGAGIDDPHDHDLSPGLADHRFGFGGTSRVANRTIFGNVLYDLNEAVRIGFELSHWDTAYKDIEDGESWRFQTSVIFSF